MAKNLTKFGVSIGFGVNKAGEHYILKIAPPKHEPQLYLNLKAKVELLIGLSEKQPV